MGKDAQLLKVKRSLVVTILTALIGRIFPLLSFEFTFVPRTKVKSESGKETVKSPIWRVHNGMSKLLMVIRGGSVESYFKLVAQLIAKTHRVIEAGEPEYDETSKVWTMPKAPTGKVPDALSATAESELAKYLTADERAELKEALEFIFLDDVKRNPQLSVTYAVAREEITHRDDADYIVRITGTDSDERRKFFDIYRLNFLSDVPANRRIYISENGSKGELIPVDRKGNKITKSKVAKVAKVAVA